MATKKTHTELYNHLMITREGVWVQGKEGDYKVCSFGLKILYRIQSPLGDISWLIAIQPPDRDDVTISLSNKEFATPAAFHEALLRYGFVFWGEKPALTMIKEDLIPNAEQAEAIASVGYHPGSGLFFFVNGAQTPGGQFIEPDAFGMIHHEKKAYFLPFLNAETNKNYKNFVRYRFEPGELTVDTWIDKMAAAHKKSLFPVCFRIAAYFRDIAFKHVRFFPLLYLHGIPNAGKSTLARSLTATDGTPQEEWHLKTGSTQKSIPRDLEQVSNSIVWYDEWQNALPEQIKGTLQAVYDGGGYKRAAANYTNQTNSVDILSALMLTGNEIPNEEYMRQRCLFINFDSAKADAAQYQAFSALTGIELGNLSSVGSDILKFRKVIEAEWKATHADIFKRLIAALPSVERRICNNLAVIITPAEILQKKRVIDLQKAYGLKESLFETAKQCCLKQQALLEGKSDLSRFFETLAYCAERRVIREGEDYRYSSDGKTLSIRMPRVYPIYLREFRAMFNRVGASREDLTGEIKRHPSFLKETQERFDVPGAGKQTEPGQAKKQAAYPAIKFNVEKFAESFPLTLSKNADE